MEKTQSFIELNSKWQILNQYVVRINTFKESSPGLVLENCKALIESIFKTILVEVNSKTEEDLKKSEISDLYRQVRQTLLLDNKVYCNIIGSFSNAISEFRNKLGEISHGKDIYTLESNLNKLFKDELDFLLNTSDDVAFFLLSYYKDQYPVYSEKKKIIQYEDNASFNEFIDEIEKEVNLGGVTLLPSRVLFFTDIEAYKANLLEHSGKNGGSE
jgi:hypothetical protein